MVWITCDANMFPTQVWRDPERAERHVRNQLVDNGNSHQWDSADADVRNVWDGRRRVASILAHVVY